MLTESPFIVSDVPGTQGLFMEFSESLFGVKPENVQPTVWDAAFMWIADRFIGITINDVVEAYKSAEIEKKPFTTLTRDELIAPIKTYWHKKTNLVGALTAGEQQEKETEDKRLAFRKKSEVVYRESLEAGAWSGDMFEANALARDYAGYFNQEEKNKMWSAAQQEHAQKTAELKAALEEDPYKALLPVPMAEFFYSEKIIIASVKRGIASIVE